MANDLAAKAYAENAKLAAPHETGANLSDALLEQTNYQIAKHGMIPKLQETHVVMDEPVSRWDTQVFRYITRLGLGHMHAHTIYVAAVAAAVGIVYMCVRMYGQWKYSLRLDLFGFTCGRSGDSLYWMHCDSSGRNAPRI